jgi:uncharacterized protein (TIGR00369 family)
MKIMKVLMCSEFSDSKAKGADYTNFFQGEEFSARYPGIELPPQSFVSSKAEILHFESGSSIVLAFQVRTDQTNPIGTLQGGVLCSFFDDAFGTLSFASVRKPCVSIDLTVNFIRAMKPGETVTIRAEIKSRNKKILHLYAEALNGKRKIVATAKTICWC